MVKRLLHLCGPIAVIAVLLTPALTAPAHAQPGPGVGWVRVGHLAPEVPPVDIYVTAFGQQQKLVIRKAGYGAVTPYATIQPGEYTVAMRLADTSAEAPPALSATVNLTEGSAYSLLVFANGPGGSPKPVLVTDTLASTGAGNGGIRVVQGSAVLTPVSVAVNGGASLATDVAYGVTTPFVTIPAGPISLRLTSGAAQTDAMVDVTAGSVVTLLVTQQADGLRAIPIVDGLGAAAPPLLGVETGAGATASGSTVPGWLIGIPVVVLALFLLRRRAAHAG
jgi:hypothetical protein